MAEYLLPEKLETLLPQAKELYASLEESVTQARKQALKDDKEFSVVVLEAHRDKGNMLVQHMLLDITRKNGIPYMLVEFDEQTLKEAQEEYRQEEYLEQSYPEVQADALSKGMRLIPADDYTLSKEARDGVMVDTLKNTEGNSLLIAGFFHGKGVLDRHAALSEDRQLLVLNLAANNEEYQRLVNLTPEQLAELKKPGLGEEARKQLGFSPEEWQELKDDPDFIKLANAQLADTLIAAERVKLIDTSAHVTQVEIAPVFDALSKSEVMHLAAAVTDQPSLPNLLRAQDPRQPSEIGNIDLVRQAGATQAVIQLLADPQLDGAWQKMDIAEREWAKFHYSKDPKEKAMAKEAGERWGEAEDVYDGILAKKARALGIDTSNEELMKAVKDLDFQDELNKQFNEARQPQSRLDQEVGRFKEGQIAAIDWDSQYNGVRGDIVQPSQHYAAIPAGQKISGPDFG